MKEFEENSIAYNENCIKWLRNLQQDWEEILLD